MDKNIEDLSEREIFVLAAIHLGKSSSQLKEYSKELKDLIQRGFVNWSEHDGLDDKDRIIELPSEIQRTFTKIFQAQTTISGR